MVSAAAFHQTLGIVGNISYYGLFLSPVPTFYSIYKKRAVEDFSPNPYIVSILNCALWVYYGVLHPESILGITINVIGLIIEFMYVALYLTYADKKQRNSVLRKSIMEFVFFLGVVLSCSLIPDLWNRGIAIGVVCDMVNIHTYAMPCDQFYHVYKTKNLEYMPLWLSLMGLLNSACWFTYAMLRLDPYILASNGVGCVLSIIQLGVYAHYYLKYPQSKNTKIVDHKKAD
ncbi:hypothetical protein MKX03_029555 [Papaver bracteatum]|nr:hypothetical protein MKX03_029555 [Papaver bracteatum]